MEKLKNLLEGLGLRKSEIEVYLALVPLKESTVLEISRQTGLHRANIYDALDGLIKRGLVFHFDEPAKKYYARDPSSILDFIKRKELEFKGALEEFRAKNTIPHEGRIGKTRGKTAVVEAFFGLLNQDKTILGYGLNEKVHSILGFSENNFHRDRINKGICMQLIYNTDNPGTMLEKGKKKGVESRCLPKKFNTGITTLISGKKINIINNDENMITVTEIEDEDIAKAYADYFDILWRNSKGNFC